MSLLEEALENRVLQASDLGALSLLVECVATGGCDIPPDRVGALLDKLIARNPQEVWLQLSKYQLQVAADVSSIERLQTLDKAATISPRHPSIHDYRIREKGQLGDVGGMYEVVRYWLFHDSKRRDLPSIMPLFRATDRTVLPLGEVGTRQSPRT
jgi:hypothetical protein